MFFAALMCAMFLTLAALREMFVYHALWWRWVSMFIVHVPLFAAEAVVIAVLVWDYRNRKEAPDSPSPFLFVLTILFPLTLAITHAGMIATASWWFLMPAALPTACVYALLMAQGL